VTAGTTHDRKLHLTDELSSNAAEAWMLRFILISSPSSVGHDGIASRELGRSPPPHSRDVITETTGV